MTAPTPTVDPVTQAFIDATSKYSLLHTLTVAEARASLEASQAPGNPSLDSVDHEVLDIPVGPTGSVNIHLFKPKERAELTPALVVIHGGAWIAGSPTVYQSPVLDLIKGTGAGVFFINYTLAPEAVYPWLYANGKSLGLDPEKVALVGDSAGGNFTIGITLLSLQRQTRLPIYQVLIYPVTDISKEAHSYALYPECPALHPDTIRWLIGIWAPDVSRRTEILASPVLATNEDLKGYPPTLLFTVELDALREEAEQFGRNLMAAGVDTTIFRTFGSVHGFALCHPLSKTPAAVAVSELINLKLKKALA